MIANFFKTAIRNLTRNKVFSFINIFGLAVGLATCLLIMLYIAEERSYDKHQKNGDRIYRVAIAALQDGNSWPAISAPIAWSMKSDLPEVEQVARLLTHPDIKKMALRVDYNGEHRQFFESNGYYVDSTFFQVLTYRFTYGHQQTALNQPNSIVLSQSLSLKLFGQGSPLGRVIQIATAFGDFNYSVTGVFDDSHTKSHIPANFFLSMRNNDWGLWADKQTNWATNNTFFTYIRLKSGTDVAAFSKRFNPYFHRRGDADMKKFGNTKNLFLQPLRDIYLHSNLTNEIAPNGNATYLKILGAIAVFILLIACINFMNLSTARSEKRAREVGVRKVIGASRGSLIAQFMGESFFMSLLALALAILLAWNALPLFNTLTGKHLQPMDQPWLILGIAGLTIFTGVLSGIYPAFYLSGFRPAAVLKGKILTGFSATAIRKGLVVSQFTISIGLILCAIVIGRQLDYLRSRNLGFAKEQRIVLPLELGYNNTERNYTMLKNELLKNPQVHSVTGGSTYPGIASISDMLFYAEGKNASDVVDVSLANVEDDYVPTLGFTLLKGRTFSRDYGTDSSGIILNETAVRELGYTLNNAVGKSIYANLNDNHIVLQIVGVVKDFNFKSLHNPIEPFGFESRYLGNSYSYLIASTTTNDYAGLLRDFESAWHRVLPNTSFSYSFLDQDFQRNYERDRQTAHIVIDFTIIAIFIACMGLFGLAAFAAEQRAREIGIRKVLGASVFSITTLLSKEFLRLVLVSILIASPLAGFVMNRWLQGFAYQTHLSWWMFAAAGALAIVIALLTISFQSIRSALANPVKSLKAE